MNASTRLGTKIFLPADQEAFAALSGDVNPMHVDAIAARRTQAGAPVVHGVHVLMWGMEQLLAARPEWKFTDLAVRFERFIYVGETVEAVLDEAPSGLTTLEFRTDSTRAAVATLSGSLDVRPMALSIDAPHPIGAPRIWDLADFHGLSGAFATVADEVALTARFPKLCQSLGHETVRSLAALSTLVGMECPGLLSIFSKLHVALDPAAQEPQGAMHYSVRRLQPLLRSTFIDVRAPGLAGNVEAFVRHPPITQPSIDSLRPTMPAGSTADDHVLVVGGSRGLGELTAKLVSLGGARVTITYARGSTEAQAVADEINASGGLCEIARLDAALPIADQMDLRGHTFTHCYYYATPPIFRKRGAIYDHDTLATFNSFYIDFFYSLAEALVSGNEHIKVFSPSTTAIDENPAGSLEYVISKTSAELLVQELSRKCPNAHFHMSRFPRILTDQTATVLPVKSEDPLSILVPLIGQLHNI